MCSNLRLYAENCNVSKEARGRVEEAVIRESNRKEVSENRCHFKFRVLVINGRLAVRTAKNTTKNKGYQKLEFAFGFQSYGYDHYL